MRSIAKFPFPEIAAWLVTAALLCALVRAESPFAVRVLDYAPAPGQFVNDPVYNDPGHALGPPVGSGTSAPANESVVSLGGYGGFIVLGFDHTVLDHPLNPLGLDSIVFSNAFWVGGNPDRHWAECATIEISRDGNENGQADDAWFLIPGSHLSPPLSRSPETWNDGSKTYAYRLSGSPFEAAVVVNPFSGTDAEGIFGYAEYSPTLLLGDLDADNIVDDKEIVEEEFYTIPDDPFEVGITSGSGGGDAFDIAWAVDAASGEPANLDGFDFLRITTPTHYILPTIGEKSAEIDAVADVAPDPHGDADADGDIDLADMAEFQVCVGLSRGSEQCQVLALDQPGVISLQDAAAIMERMTGPS